MTEPIEMETINKLYLELSLVATATTWKEIQFQKQADELAEHLEGVAIPFGAVKILNQMRGVKTMVGETEV